MHLSALLNPGSVPPDADATVSVLLDLAGTARSVSLRVPVGPRLSGVRVVGGTPSRRLPDGSLVVELGDFRSGESRRLLLRLEIPGQSCPGPATVTALEAAYVDPATLTAHTAVLPVTVDVVPEAEARTEAEARPEAQARTAGPGATAGRTRTGDASCTAASLRAGRSGRTRERGRDGAPPREGVIRGEQTDRGRPTPDRAPPAPGGGGRRGSGTSRDPEHPPNG
jgi:Ca-activated chloride channel family protein